ncbi:MAG: HAD family hydrolase [Chloroflexi bacterium]|nr:HAD family hydrolase [Chloroflexota bacterium]MBU1752208.1 HAD family hydrolase [Chloroflexota bacterium]MBU1877398.1 HAD family hydrolase [Chloroflexota bacterium]
MHIVAFDCDGVLVDYYGEDFVVSHNALLAVDPLADPLGRGRTLLAHHDLALATRANPVFAGFRDLATFAARAEDYLPTWQIIMQRPQDIPAMTEEAFEEARRRSVAGYAEFKAAFYRARQSLQDQDLAAWRDMIPLFPGLADAVTSVSRAGGVVVVATGRDGDSTWRLLEHHGISGYVTELVSREFSSQKDRQMEYLVDHYEVDPAQLLFIDDALRNVQAVQGWATPWLATWGGARPEHVAQAEREGIATVSLEELPDQLMRWIGGTI